jgi:hypothetical protein
LQALGDNCATGRGQNITVKKQRQALVERLVCLIERSEYWSDPDGLMDIDNIDISVMDEETRSLVYAELAKL